MYNDKNIGRLTYKNSSTVDYVLASTYTIEFIREFAVLDFCNLYSDVHNPISFSFSHCKNLSTNECIGENQPTVKLWSADKAQDFCKNIDTSAVDAIQLDLEEMSVCVNNVYKTSVTTITTKICNVFHKAASDTFGNYNMGCNKFSGKKSNNKPWFNKECRKARKNFHLAKKNHNNCILSLKAKTISGLWTSV